MSTPIFAMGQVMPWGYGTGSDTPSRSMLRVCQNLYQRVDNIFPGEIIGVQEGIEGHGQVGVPVGIAQKDHVVVVQVFNRTGQLQAGILPQLLEFVRECEEIRRIL